MIFRREERYEHAITVGARRMRVVVTGGAGFLGSHLCEVLLARGDSVICVDDLSSGRIDNVADMMGRPAFDFVRLDVSDGIDLDRWDGPIDAVAHLASPASPVDYLRRPLQTLAVGSRGTEYALDLARRHSARFLLASTSEVYGDPLVHPQVEGYWGNVNPVGPRSVYDEAKRFGESLTTAYRHTYGVRTGIVRIFNTYGPRMRPDDGRVVSSLVCQALRGEPMTIHGDGSQTRSFCYVDDLVRGLVAMIDSDEPGPVNLGNPDERTVLELAAAVLRLTGSPSPVAGRPLPVDDPARRCPDIGLAGRVLGWKPEVDLDTGLSRTIAWFAAHEAAVEPAGAVMA